MLSKKEKRGALTAEEAREILDAILALPLETLGHRELVAHALALSRECSLTVYDALFLSAAVRRKADLITADALLREAFDQLG